MNKSGKIKCAVLAAVALPVSAAAVWGAGWLWSLRDAGPVAPATAVLAPERASAPGKPVTAELTLRVPLWRRVRSVTAEPGTGSVLSGTAGISSSWRWSYRIWRISATLRALSSDGASPGKLLVELSPAAGEETGPLAFEIPPLRVDAPDAAEKAEADSPLLAGVETPPRDAGKRYFPLLLLLPAAALAGWWFYRRRRRAEAEALPPWERARAALGELRSGIAAGTLAPVAGIERLTDVVRRYLEERFDFPASRLTTPEFLAHVAGSPELSASERAFLRDFMTGADLVKFARAPAAREAFDDAADKAELLVDRTTPREEDKTAPEAAA